MITRITVDNFMSHVHTVIEPCESLTVLVGPNNCGKSAIVAAIQALCRSERGAHMLRHGEKESLVSLETDEGHTVEWRRKKSGAVTYVVDGKEVHRVVPEDLHDHLRLPLVAMKDGADEFDVHFGEQKQPIFLLNESGRHAATFFASSSDAEFIVRMQALHKQRTAEAKAIEKQLSAEILDLERRIEELAPSVLLSERLGKLEVVYEEITATTLNMEALAESIEQLKAASVLSQHQGSILAPLNRLQVLPDQLDEKSLEAILQELDRADSVSADSWTNSSSPSLEGNTTSGVSGCGVSFQFDHRPHLTGDGEVARSGSIRSPRQTWSPARDDRPCDAYFSVPRPGISRCGSRRKGTIA